MPQMSKEEYNKINEKLDKINRGLYGEDENDQQGLVDRVKALEELAEKLNNAKWYVLGIFGVMIAAWSVAQGVIEMVTRIKGG